jgi:2-polyprenyl-6-methoxyphenol hydroxylase-like FAD-dependent oxidoreductase
VVQVGGSLAGLCTGIVLLRLGHNVTILERSTPSLLLDQGAGISVAPYVPPIIASLKQLGKPNPIFEFFKEYDRTGKPWCNSSDQVSIQFLKRDGTVKHAMDLTGKLLGTASWELLYNSLRANFDGKAENGFINRVEKREEDGKAEYLHGLQVVSLHDVGSEGVEVVCVDKEGEKVIRKANLVVGADGPSSTIRSKFLPDITREYVGYVAWRGTVTQDEVSAATRESLKTPSFSYTRGNHAVQ